MQPQAYLAVKSIVCLLVSEVAQPMSGRSSSKTGLASIFNTKNVWLSMNVNTMKARIETKRKITVHTFLWLQTRHL
jgi:hypothetical protein